MKYIRIGNDIHIEWIILRNMQPESFVNKEVTVKLYDKNGLPQNFEFTKNGSSIVGTFYGKDQVTTGNYRLELVENAGKSNMVTLDYIDCFILSAKLKNTTASGKDSSYGIKTDVVNLASNINLTGGSTTDVDLSSYAKISYVDAKLALKANLSDIPKPVDTSNFALKSEIPNMSEYAKKSDIPSMENVATKDELPDMDNVATKDELFSGDYNDLSNKPSIPDTSNFALKSELPDMSNVATKDEIPSMENVATKDEIPVIPEFKTINGNSIVGTGNITIAGGGQAYDDTELRNRIGALESKPDNDTIYDDSALIGRIEALEQKEDADTIYDDTEIRILIEGKQDAGDYALKSELPNLDDYALKSEIPTSTGLNENEVNALIDAKLGEIETKLSEI